MWFNWFFIIWTLLILALTKLSAKFTTRKKEFRTVYYFVLVTLGAPAFVALLGIIAYYQNTGDWL